MSADTHDVLSAYVQRWSEIIGSREQIPLSVVRDSAVRIAEDMADGRGPEARNYSPVQRSNIAAVALASALMKQFVAADMSPVERHRTAMLLPVFISATVAVPFDADLSRRFVGALRRGSLESALSLIRRSSGGSNTSMRDPHYAELHAALLSGDSDQVGDALEKHSDKSGRVGIASMLWQREKVFLAHGVISAAAYCLFSTGSAAVIGGPGALGLAAGGCLAMPLTEMAKTHISGWGNLGVGKLFDGIFAGSKRYLGWNPDEGLSGPILRQTAAIGLMVGSQVAGESVRAAVDARQQDAQQYAQHAAQHAQQEEWLRDAQYRDDMTEREARKAWRKFNVDFHPDKAFLDMTPDERLSEHQRVHDRFNYVKAAFEQHKAGAPSSWTAWFFGK